MIMVYTLDVTTIEPLRIININIYFAADGKPVMTEVYIQVLYL